MDYSIGEIQSKLLETFIAFDDFCKRHGIKYFITGGTLIGAVRHHGFIPWDDDIDVWMLPDDYDRFCSFRGNVEGHYDIMDDRDDHYWLFSLAKFVDTETTLWESEEYPCITGIYVDIFPLRESNAENAVKLINRYVECTEILKRAMKHYSFNIILSYIRKKDVNNLLGALKDIFYYIPRYKRFRKEYEDCLEEIKRTKGNKYICCDGSFGEKEVYDKEWFEKTVILKFESMEVDAPSEYHRMLTQLYGDYMQLPPEEKRISFHPHYFVDLNRRWTKDEIKEYKRIYG